MVGFLRCLWRFVLCCGFRGCVNELVSMLLMFVLFGSGLPFLGGGCNVMSLVFSSL